MGKVFKSFSAPVSWIQAMSLSILAIVVSILTWIQVEIARADDSHSSINDLDWNPDAGLDQVVDQLEEILENLMQQQPMNYTSANIASVRDAQLFILFVKYFEGLPPEQRISAIKEQEAWLEQRFKSARLSASEYEGGTMYGLIYSGEYASVTSERIEYYKRLSETPYIPSSSNVGSCLIKCSEVPYHLYLDGQYWTLVTTPSYLLTGLAGGEHWITASKDGYYMYSKCIAMDDSQTGQSANSVEVMLEKQDVLYKWISLQQNGFGLFCYEYRYEDTDWCFYETFQTPYPSIQCGLSSPSGDWFAYIELAANSDKYKHSLGEMEGYATVINADGRMAYVPYYWKRERRDGDIIDFHLDYSITNPRNNDVIWFHLTCSTFEGLDEYFADFHNEWIHGVVRLY